MNKGFSFFKKHEDGQVLVLVALMLVGLIGFAALLTDGGMMQLSRRELQAAADAAALAGASYLPGDPNMAIITAEKYIEKNILLDPDFPPIIDPFYDAKDGKEILVVLELPATFTFGRIFKPSDSTISTISASAVARAYNAWDGDALPFINQDDQDDYEEEGELWVKVSPGNFESMYESDEHGWTLGKDECSFTVDYENGLAVKNGVVASKKDEVKCVVETYGSGYVFSLSIDAINKDEVYVKTVPQGTFEWRYLQTSHKRNGEKLKDLKNNDIIQPYAKDINGNEYIQLVLYEIVEVKYHDKEKEIDFKLNKVYNIFDRDNPEIPESGFSMNGAKPDLVE